ncbi:MAG: hypothetical protein ACLP1X_01175 [Polyangiaceae bacterium]|jgi:hypothetical protein
MKTSSIRKRNNWNYTQVQDDFDDLVMAAARGDARAVDAIEEALGPMLIEEARVVLGEYADEGEHVLQALLVVLLEGRTRFRPSQGRAVVWLCRMAHAIAQTWRKRKENEKDWPKSYRRSRGNDDS